MIETIYYGFFMGLCATLAMDLWAVIQHRIWNFPLPNWAMPGRWFAYLFHGRFFHQDIGQTKEIPNELALGWLFHYGVGVAYGMVFLLIVGAEWLMQPDFLSAWIFALVTIAAGWFILLPGMGLGTYTSAVENERAWSRRSYSFWPGPMGIWTLAWLGRSKPT